MRLAIAVMALFLSGAAAATDLVRSGTSAASVGSANILGLARDSLAAVSGNPAILTSVGHSNQFSLSTLYVDAGFRSRLGEYANARGPAVVPEFALSRHVPNSNWFWGAGLTVQSAMEAEFEFVDPPGAAGVSYGRQTHRSLYAVVNVAGNIAYKINDSLSLGATLGVAYNRNELESPYIFQSHPLLQNLKVLVDLKADDVALTAALGLDYAINDEWQFNLLYNLETKFSAEGDLSGNLSQLGMGIQEDFSYSANVRTALPASLVAGLTWQASERLQLGLQYDWINWEDSFDTLPIRLTEGTNQSLNAYLGENSINDTAPLAWHDQHVIHVGGKFGLKDGRTLRAGIEHGNVIVPRATVTPMTAAILETAYSIGLDFEFAGSRVDVAYRLSRGSDLEVLSSGLKSGEYSGTRLSLRLHTLAVSFSF